MKTFWVAFFALLVMPLLGQAPKPVPVPPPPAKQQTALLGTSGGLFVFNNKHEVVAYCASIVGKTVSDCAIAKGHTTTEAIQGMLDTFLHQQ